jgi:hypothetical protein
MPVIPLVPPGQWLDAEGWTWKDVVLTGVGTDANLYTFAYDDATGAWLNGRCPASARLGGNDVCEPAHPAHAGCAA